MGLALLTGLIYYAAFPGIGWWPLAPIAYAPLLVAIRHRRPRSAAALGLLAGTITTSLGFIWLLDTLHTYSGFSMPTCILLYLLLSIFQGGRLALFAALCSALARNRWPWLVCVAAAFVTSEVAYPLLFPWFFGASLHHVPLLIQTADIGGPVLVGLPLALFSAGLARCLTSKTPLRAQRTTLIGMALTLALPSVYGMLLIPLVDHNTAQAPTLRVGLVQGNIPHTPKVNRRARRTLPRPSQPKQSPAR